MAENMTLEEVTERWKSLSEVTLKVTNKARLVQAESRALKAENAELKAENAELMAQNAELMAALAQAVQALAQEEPRPTRPCAPASSPHAVATVALGFATRALPCTQAEPP